MQRALDLPGPEVQELVQHGISRGDVQILPDVGLQHVGMVRQVVQDLGCGQAIILRLPDRGHGCLASFQSTLRPTDWPDNRMMLEKRRLVQQETQYFQQLSTLYERVLLKLDTETRRD